ncbi:hypothetical protein ACFFSY_07270 [Paenibacillus aurantiacus]|uniref:Uncharacterized protein n=1 Tax=Paenibacillus aurantiacus TaxID=1936118 RepID=A0ABV5KMW8_9BACL
MTTLRQQFEQAGIALRKDVPADIREATDTIGDAETLLIVMGGTVAEGAPMSDHLWHFDMASIHGPGDYAAIAAELCRLSGGVLPIEDIADEFDTENERAYLSFTYKGQRHMWEFMVDGDWTDTNIFVGFEHLLAQAGSGLRFTCYAWEGSDGLIGCATPEQVERIAELTGVRFEWLVAD